VQYAADYSEQAAELTESDGGAHSECSADPDFVLHAD
jgi:hypothetical protein